jgi:hypothetical protein
MLTLLWNMPSNIPGCSNNYSPVKPLRSRSNAGRIGKARYRGTSALNTCAQALWHENHSD